MTNKERPEEAGCFPLFIDLWQKKILVAGAGKIAARRIAVLVQFGAEITVVAPKISEPVRKLGDMSQIKVLCKPYEPDCCQGMYMVLAATDDPVLNGKICRDARREGAIVNSASDRSQCDFYFPGIVKRGADVIGVNAGGNRHSQARQLREKIEKFFTESN